jgi:hypothetical protein
MERSYPTKLKKAVDSKFLEAYIGSSKKGGIPLWQRRKPLRRRRRRPSEGSAERFAQRARGSYRTPDDLVCLKNIYLCGLGSKQEATEN